MASKRPDIDWAEVRAFYMTGQLSNREIARRFGISDVAIVHRAKKEGWTKDLTRQVATGVKHAVLSASLAKGALRPGAKQKATEAAVVAAAIEDGKKIVLNHMQLGRLISENGQMLAEVIRRRIEMADDLDEKALSFLARAHDSIAKAAATSVNIERQARGLDDMPADPNAPPSISITYYRSDLVLQKVENGKV